MKKLKLYAIKTIRMEESEAIEVEKLNKQGFSLPDILREGIKALNNK